MSLSTFLTGSVIGFSIAAPVGPVGALTIRRTLTEGRATGVVTGLGAATADAAYGAVAAFGLTFITGFLVAQQGWLRGAGGIFLLYLGVAIFLARPAPLVGWQRASGLLSAYGTTVLLTLSNPTTIFSFLGIFAGLGLRDIASDYATASVFVLGVFLGSTLWWLILSFGTGLLRPRLDDNALRWVNRVSGAMIVAFGVYVLVGLL